MRVRILGLSATPIKGGNCETYVREALKEAEKFDWVETEFITTADKEIACCTHCQWCIENRSACKVQDDLPWIYDRMEAADGIIFGAPLWFQTISPHMQILFSRARHVAFFNPRFKDRVGGALVVGWMGAGMEYGLHTLELLMNCVRIIPVARGWAFSSAVAHGKRPAHLKNGVLDDEGGRVRGKRVGARVAEVARMMKYARDADLQIERPAKEKVFVEKVWRGMDESIA